LRYGPGDYFVAHQDGNTGLVFDDSRHRRVSVSVFLNQDSYSGGALVFHGRYPDFDVRHAARASSGEAVFFRSEMTHEVLPVISGERFAIVSWYR
jgi:SM-20-related protein